MAPARNWATTVGLPIVDQMRPGPAASAGHGSTPRPPPSSMPSKETAAAAAATMANALLAETAVRPARNAASSSNALKKSRVRPAHPSSAAATVSPLTRTTAAIPRTTKQPSGTLQAIPRHGPVRAPVAAHARIPATMTTCSARNFASMKSGAPVPVATSAAAATPRAATDPVSRPGRS